MSKIILMGEKAVKPKLGHLIQIDIAENVIVRLCSNYSGWFFSCPHEKVSGIV